MKRVLTSLMILNITVLILLSRNMVAQDHNAANGGNNRSFSELDDFFNKTISNYNYVALGACLIRNNDIIWQGSYGYSDQELKKELRTDDIFQLASLSKTVTATALMQLYEKGLFELDDDVNKYVPMNVRNPNFPDKPITIRMLLIHTNSFEDIMPNGNKISLGVKGDSQIPLKEYAEGLFTPGSKYYSLDYFSKTVEPGTSYGYSNIAFSLIGYLVEVLSGMDFGEYCRENIFKPLEMVNTSWHLKGLDTGRVIFTYGFPPKDNIRNYKKIRHFGTPGYCEGMLRTTMQDFSHFLIAMMHEGRYKDRQILKPETVKIIHTPQGVKNIESKSFRVVDMALTWKIFEVEGINYYSMNGFSGGIFTNAYYSPDNQTGMIYFYTGITMENMQGMFEITKKLHSTLKSTL